MSDTWHGFHVIVAGAVTLYISWPDGGTIIFPIIVCLTPVGIILRIMYDTTLWCDFGVFLQTCVDYCDDGDNAYAGLQIIDE